MTADIIHHQAVLFRWSIIVGHSANRHILVLRNRSMLTRGSRAGEMGEFSPPFL